MSRIAQLLCFLFCFYPPSPTQAQTCRGNCSGLPRKIENSVPVRSIGSTNQSSVPTLASNGHGLSRNARNGILTGIGVLSFLCLIGFNVYVCCTRTSSHPSPSIQLAAPTGLDIQTIESYPKTVLGESCRLPDRDDEYCPICLSEYQTEEVLRTIPDCKHYFHAHCIDQWLKMNSICPMCRKSQS